MLNIFIIVNTADPFEILLNALAFKFVIELDEKCVESRWWDRDKRWITAGAVELVLQHTLKFRAISNAEVFSRKTGIDLRELQSVLKLRGNEDRLFCNREVARKDANDLCLMSSDEAVKYLCKTVAIEMSNYEAIQEYQKRSVSFGFFAPYVRLMFGIRGGGVFNRYGVV